MKRPSGGDSATQATQAVADFIAKHPRLLRNIIVGFGILVLAAVLAMCLR